jgi:hypothetical protein
MPKIADELDDIAHHLHAADSNYRRLRRAAEQVRQLEDALDVIRGHGQENEGGE